MNPSEGSGLHSNYVITHDIGEKIAAFRRIGIKTPDPDDPFFTELGDELRNQLQHALGPDVTVRSVGMRNLADDILADAYAENQKRDSLIISTCPEIAEPMHGVTLDVNRMVDIEGASIGLGPRPGRPPLSEQLDLIKFRCQGRPVTLVEDGIFSGTTLEFIANLFESKGITIDSVIAGFSFSKARPMIDELEQRGITVHCVEEFGDMLDWVPDHDFYPLVPNCGLVLGTDVVAQPSPFYSDEGACFSIPYVKPLGLMAKWASVPEDCEDSLSKFCLASAARIYTQLGILNDGDIPLKSLIRSTQPVCLPIQLGAHELPRVGNSTAREFLNDLTHHCNLSLYNS
jgi:hypothetical protein